MNYDFNNIEQKNKPKVKKKKNKYLLIVGLFVIATVLGACGTTDEQKAVNKKYEDCDSWEYSKKEETEKCTDKSSPYFGGIFYGGTYYNNSTAVGKAKANAKVSKNTTSKTSKATSISKSGGFKSGIGSGGVKGGG